MRRRNAATEIGELTDREVLLIGAIAYWCEGTKSKPYRRHEAWSSSTVIQHLFFSSCGSAAAGCAPSQFVFRVHIHENADIEAAQRFWLRTTGASPDQFRTPTLKRHNPKTVRKKMGAEYYGCLRIDVLKSW